MSRRVAISLEEVCFIMDNLRHACLDLVFCACYRLRFNLEVTAMALSIIQRYFSRPAAETEGLGLGEDTTKLICATSLFLASKIEEAPRRLRDVINVTHRLTWRRRPRLAASSSPMLFPHPDATLVHEEDTEDGTMCLDGEYVILKAEIVDHEQKILRALGFDLELVQPFKLVLHFSIFLRWPSSPMVQHAFTLAVDSLWSEKCLVLPPESIAAASLYLASMTAEPTPNRDPAWWHPLGVSDDELSRACECLIETRLRLRGS